MAAMSEEKGVLKRSESAQSDCAEPETPEYKFSDDELKAYQLTALKVLQKYIQNERQVNLVVEHGRFLFKKNEDGDKEYLSFTHEFYASKTESEWEKASLAATDRVLNALSTQGVVIASNANIKNLSGTNWKQRLVWASLGYVVAQPGKQALQKQMPTDDNLSLATMEVMNREAAKITAATNSLFKKLVAKVDGNPFESADSYLFSANFKAAIADEIKILDPGHALGKKSLTTFFLASSSGAVGISYKIDPKGTTEFLTDPRVLYTAIAGGGMILFAAIINVWLLKKKSNQSNESQPIQAAAQSPSQEQDSIRLKS